ncbi:MAG: peptide chain release factor N(5)-glutamine methyltransferase [Cyanobacteria bacterium QH_10_48_56]|nr:MAG: peptide chain release factor N(5)-glutamine methyltransferase [Cyanobacteria bacterium QH_10_48_56]
MVSGKQLSRWRRNARQEANAAGIAPTEVDWLLQEVAGLDRLTLRLESFEEQGQIELKIPLPKLTQLWQQRLYERVPVQHLVGVTPWRNFSLRVSPDVFIPRPETEYLIELAVRATEAGYSQHLASGNWVDLGTGSGAIALGLAQAFPEATIHAVDSGTAALTMAQQNAENLGFSKRIQFYQGDWWEPFASLKGRVSGMVSNPPYIPTHLLPQLQPEVGHHEPHQALDGGSDGLDSIRHLVKTSPHYLSPGGVWLTEMMAGQAEAVTQLLQQEGSYAQVQIFPDLAGIDRFAMAYCS